MVGKHDVGDFLGATNRPKYFRCDYGMPLDRREFFPAQIVRLQEHVIPDADLPHVMHQTSQPN